MKIRQDKEADVIKITLNDRQQVGGDMVHDDLIIRLDAEGKLVAIEILTNGAS